MKNIILIIAIAIIVGGLSFYGGMKYSQSKGLAGVSFQNFQNLSPEQRAQISQQGRGTEIGGLARSGSQGQIGGLVSGEIISKDSQSITIKLRDTRLPEGEGGSKIVFFSDSTSIIKSVAGSNNDLEIGKQILVNGTNNSDGSLTAQSIQLRD